MRRIALTILRGYKRFISPLLPPACRFHPTCSEYSMGCFKHYGFFRASWMTMVRLAKCQPLHPGGYDPVPVPENVESA